ncbi:MAG: UDP-N-acetylmuramoyl-tripeptide--D-alanyl-D-alanine ligase [Eubacterium sp.]|nr:UDP-N-acetylmuramoyl-tripeptide--D-alanyl-D-alanine ligase [Eubacterium sp.]
MKNLTLSNITLVTDGKYYGSEEKKEFTVTDIVTDSRKVTNGCLFVAIRGEHADGHQFIPQVLDAGAVAVLTELSPEIVKEQYGMPEHSEFTAIQVTSTLQAVKDIAEFYLRQLNKPIVGIVGSVGKTSTKEMTASVLSQRYRVLKTEGNFNNELGVPMTVFRMREDDEIGVIEMGINHFGEMHRLASIVHPDTVIMTNIGTAHLEFLKSRDGILQAKSEVFDFFRSDGHIILNGDDDKLSTIEEKEGVKPVRFGLNKDGYSHPNDLYAEDVEPQGLDGTRCRIVTPAGSFNVKIPTPGQHMIYNALAGAAAGLAYGLTLEEIRRGIESYASLSGRFHIIHTDRYTLVDDCYNANPASMKASLGILQDGSGRRMAVLGDMGELGKDSEKLHEEVGEFAGSCNIDGIYCIGPLSHYISKGAHKTAGKKMEIRHFKNIDKFIDAIPELFKPGDTILVKASHFMQFGRIVEKLQK